MGRWQGSWLTDFVTHHGHNDLRQGKMSTSLVSDIAIAHLQPGVIAIAPSIEP